MSSKKKVDVKASTPRNKPKVALFKSSTIEELRDEMHRWMDGIQDSHDKVVAELKARQLESHRGTGPQPRSPEFQAKLEALRKQENATRDPLIDIAHTYVMDDEAMASLKVQLRQLPKKKNMERAKVIAEVVARFNKEYEEEHKVLLDAINGVEAQGTTEPSEQSAPCPEGTIIRCLHDLNYNQTFWINRDGTPENIIYGTNPHLRGVSPDLRGNNSNIMGDCSNIYGDCSGLSGDCTHIRGNCTNLMGCCSAVQGDLNQIPMQSRYNLPNIQDWTVELKDNG